MTVSAIEFGERLQKLLSTYDIILSHRVPYKQGILRKTELDNGTKLELNLSWDQNYARFSIQPIRYAPVKGGSLGLSSRKGCVYVHNTFEESPDIDLELAAMVALAVEDMKNLNERMQSFTKRINIIESMKDSHRDPMLIQHNGKPFSEKIMEDLDAYLQKYRGYWL